MAADWSELTPDLIGEIAKNICRIENFIVFSSVCPSWKLAAVRENWVSDDRQLPWLLLAEPPEIEEEEEEEEEENRQWCRKFLNLNNNKRYDLPVPNFRGSKVFGSNHGWMFTFNLRFEMHLINPLSGLKLSLPHYATFKHPRPSSCSSPQFRLYSKWRRDFLIEKALVFKMKDQLFVAVIYGEFLYLAIAKPGDQSWTEVELQVNAEASPWVEDVIFCNDQLFVIDSGGALLICQFEVPNPRLIEVSAPPIGFDCYRSSKSYLVESVAQLLFLARYVDTDYMTESYKTSHFDVWKFDFEKNKWVKLDSLGDRALFVGNSSSMSLSSAMVSACQRNSIYFTDDYFTGAWDCVEEGYAGHDDIGIYNLEKHTCYPLPYRLDARDHCSSFSCPVWMKPSLF